MWDESTSNSPPRSFAQVLKSDAEINKLKLDEAKAYAKTVTKSLHSFYQHLFDPANGVIVKLQSQLAVSQKINETLMRQLTDVERSSINNSQYARCETLELHGVPESFDNGSGLEANVISLLNEIAPDAAVKEEDLQAVHRLKKRQNVILKFISRKKRHAVIIHKGKLKDESIKVKHHIRGKIFLHESMCYELKHLYYLCGKLKHDQNKLAHYNFFNGSIRVKTEEDGNRHIISHISDLVKLTGMSRSAIENLA